MKHKFYLTLTVAAASVFSGSAAHAAVSAQQAAELKTTLTPLGGERAGNREGSIPAWTGGIGSPTPAFTTGARRADPFAADKKLYSVSVKNMAEHADKLTEGTKALLKRYPDSYRIDVYPTRRTASAPQWVYDNTFKNATRATLDGKSVVSGAYGGVPFPIPANGAEVMWNNQLRWRGVAWQVPSQSFLGTAEGRLLMTADVRIDQEMPYYFEDGSLEKFDGTFLNNRVSTDGPPIRAGEAIASRLHIDDDKTLAWVYLAGQRRVRKLPNACCDTPTPPSAGVMSFDELNVFSGRMDRFDWKILGKKEMLIPYNANAILQPTKSADVLMLHHLNPDHVRWELHRVWVVEANLKPGARHVAPRNVYYIDEDSWNAVLGDRYDAKGQLWKAVFQLPVAAPDLPGVISGPYGFMDLLSGTWFVIQIWNEKKEHYKPVPRFRSTYFTSDALAGEGVR